MSLRELLSAKQRVDDALYQHEQALLDPAVRGSREQLESLLHVDFFETGSSGESYDRETMIDMMLGESPGQVVMRDFITSFLSSDIGLVTYRSVGTGGQEAKRSSVWVFEDGRWQLRHHQGTRVPDRWGRVH
ncbi:MAG TPA: nuclear transport factor 2 family protein [Acidimicrobiia bacterium]|nr:nuclear transport factor 2 family protein [Acidimicrobiia bacterium]